MNLNAEVQIAIAIGNLVFLAGGAWFLLKQLRREVGDMRSQVNGVGGKVRESQALDIAREPDEAKRFELARTFFGAKR